MFLETTNLFIGITVNQKVTMVLTLIETDQNDIETRRDLDFIEITTPDDKLIFYDGTTSETIFFIIPDANGIVINYMDRNQSLDMISEDWVMRLRIVVKDHEDTQHKREEQNTN